MIQPSRWLAAACVCLVFCARAVAGQAADLPKIVLEPFVTGLTLPVYMTDAPDNSGRMFVLEKYGKVRVITPNRVVRQVPFLDIGFEGRNWIETLQDAGLLSMLFHPEYATTGSPHAGRFFLFFTSKTNNANTIVEMRTKAGDPVHADTATSTTLISLDHESPWHNGGSMAWGPDGMLYTAFGDGGSQGDSGPGHTPVTGNAQDMGKLLGKMIRIDVNNKDAGLEYAIPPDNPFVGQIGVRHEIFALGFRSPWRFSFDREGDRRLFLSDVGQDRVEEVDVIQSGKNYGWRIKEGDECFSPQNPYEPDPNGCDETGLEPPIHTYLHVPPMRGAIIGGYVYRGSRYPLLNGLYFYADYAGQITALRETTPGVWEIAQVYDGRTEQDDNFRVSSFAEDRKGELYVLDFINGKIFHLAALATKTEPDWRQYR